MTSSFSTMIFLLQKSSSWCSSCYPQISAISSRLFPSLLNSSILLCVSGSLSIALLNRLCVSSPMMAWSVRSVAVQISAGCFICSSDAVWALLRLRWSMQRFLAIVIPKASMLWYSESLSRIFQSFTRVSCTMSSASSARVMPRDSVDNVPSTWGAFPGRYVQILFLPFVPFYVYDARRGGR